MTHLYKDIVIWLGCCLLILSFLSCSDTTLTASSSETSESDSTPDLPVDTPSGEEVEGEGTDNPETDNPDTQDEEPTSGDFLSPCENGEQCNSGYCIQFEDQYVCTQFCGTQDCPPGWGCKQVVNAGADVVFICVPNEDTLCKPCSSNTDCGQFGDMCIDLDSLGSYVCGRDCSVTFQCPEYYYCASVTDRAGATGDQCIPTTGQCSCTPAEDGQSRACVRENLYGICEGVEVCQGEDGWTGCTAREPAEEDCNNVDDDCDDLVDEELTDRACLGLLNQHGQCRGIESCEGAAGWVCSAPVATPEICDGEDNDCNEIIDDGICYDGNECTDDLCDPDTDMCYYPPKNGPCDDFNPCTVQDHCDTGLCVGAPKDCDDGNPCTADTCVRATGQCRNDVGSCPSSTTCMNYRLDGNGCCVEERLTGNRCDDNDDCTSNDLCSNGQCLGGAESCTGQSCHINLGLGSGDNWEFCLDHWCTEGGIGGDYTCWCFCLGG